MINVPTGSTLQGASNEGNSVTWQLPGHTVQKPRLLIFKRVLPTYNQSKQTWSDPKYGLKVVFGVVNSDGLPVRPNIQIGTDGITFPMSGVDVAASVGAALTEFKSVVAGLSADDILAQTLPLRSSAEG